jgi:hypothetical protein
MNVEIGTETQIFLFWEYLFQNFGILSLQCDLPLLFLHWKRKCYIFNISWDYEHVMLVCLIGLVNPRLQEVVLEHIVPVFW